MIINITLTDINDNAPVFSDTILATYPVKENKEIGYLVFDVDASDSVLVSVRPSQRSKRAFLALFIKSCVLG